MPYRIFDFECWQCGYIHEELLEEDKDYLLCPKCGKTSRKIITLGHGGIFSDTNISWLESACMTLLRPGEKMLTTREEYKRYLKQNDVMEKGGNAKIDGKFSMV